MSPHRTPLLLVCLAAAVVGQANIDLAPVPCLGCSKLYLQHYAARGCEAVFDDAVSLCCPASFKCSPEVLRSDLSSCSYKGKAYAIGEDVPIQDPCQAGCFCRESIDGPPTVECAQVECPSLFNPPQPGCRNLYNIDQCCEVDKQCVDLPIPVAPVEVEEEAATTPALETGAETEGGPRTTTCSSEGKEYQLGDKIYFDEDPCQYCVCTEDFTDAYGTNCTSIDCGMDYRYAQELQDGCTPVYFRGGCCSIEWICPNSDRVKPLPEPPQPSEEPTPAQCRLGDIVAPRGDSLPTDNCNLNCVCSTPPDFTCVQYTSCDEAAAALNAEKSTVSEAQTKSAASETQIKSAPASEAQTEKSAAASEAQTEKSAAASEAQTEKSAAASEAQTEKSAAASEAQTEKST